MKKKANLNPLLRRILEQHRFRILLLCIITVLLSVLQVAMALLFRFVIDAALAPEGKLLFWGIMLAADMLAIVLAHTLLSWLTASTADRVNAALRQQILCTAVYSRDEALLDHHSGELLNRGMEDVNTLCDGAVSALPGFVGQITRLVAAFAAVLMLSDTVAVVLIIGALLIGGVTACLRPALKKRQRLVRESDEQMMAALQENLQQLELIQSLDAQEQTLVRFGKRLKKNLSMRFRRRIWSVGSSAVIHAASQLSAGALLLWGAGRIASGVLSYGTLTALLQLLAQFRAPALGLSGIWSRLASVEVAAERLSSLLTPAQAIRKQPVDAQIRAIVFDNVTFSYPGDEMPVLKDFHFRFPLEGWSCLTGISGKGKTTIFKLILGLHKPQQGRIYLETDSGEIPCTEATRHLFAYVPQDYALFSGTVLENFQLIDPDISEDKLREILQIAQADFIWELADREQTQVRENNAGLSKGQLQRLAIARAVLMDRPVFLLDECTSALDAQTEDALLRSLKTLGKQAILVTHRPEALQTLDHVNSVSMEQ
jgi:ATP-binding cassette subfamily B protein